MTDRKRTIVLVALAVLLAPVLLLVLLAVSLMSGEFLCGRIYRGDHEGISDLCGFGSAVVLFALLLVASVAAVSPLRRHLRLK